MLVVRLVALKQLDHAIPKRLADGPSHNVWMHSTAADGFHFASDCNEGPVGTEDSHRSGDSINTPVLRYLVALRTSRLRETVRPYAQAKEVEEANVKLEDDSLTHKVMYDSHTQLSVSDEVPAFIVQIQRLTLHQQ